MRSALVALFVVAAGCGSGGLMENPDSAMAPDQAMMPPDMTAIPPDMTKPPADLSNPLSNADFSAVGCGMDQNGKPVYCAKGMNCCITPTDGGGFSQTCAASCADGGISEMCDGPQQCDPNGKKYCCANVDVGAGNPPNCPFTAQSACTTQCQTNVQLQCPAMDVVRLCHVAADCADDPSNANCCVLMMGGNSVTGCFSDLISGFIKQGGGQCYK